MYRLISIHAPRVGRDDVGGRQILHVFQFQSTRPVWGATFTTLPQRESKKEISIHAPRVGRDARRGVANV